MLNKLPCMVLFFLILIASASPAYAIDKENATSMIIADGFKFAAVNAGDDMVNDGQLSENGSENVFAATIQTPDYYNDPNIKASTDNSKKIFKFSALVLLFILGIFCVYQEVFPTSAAEMSTHFNNGKQTYYQPKDIFSYGAKVGGWFVFGPAILICMLWSCAGILNKMDTSVLSQLVISSENVSSYLVFGVCAKGIKYYMALRELIITYAIIAWYLIGLVFAWKKTRWVGVLCMGYTAVQIYVQILIVAVLVVTVNRVYDGGISWASDMLALGAMVIGILWLCFTALFFPVVIKFLKPSAITKMVSYVRYAL